MVLAGVGLRLAQWLGNPSLWLDELQLVRNILDRGAVELLLHGLDRGQVAPVGYLLPTKVATLLFGDGELALRAVPVAASLLALVLFWRVAQSLLVPPGAFVATAGFALNPLLISLGSTVKPYATDVLGTILVLVALRSLWNLEGSVRDRVLVVVGAGAIGFLSTPSVMVACAAITALLYRYRALGRLRRLDRAVPAVTPLLVWGLLALAGALWARALMIHGVAARTAYWTRVGGFAPPFSDYPTWILDRWSGSILPQILLQPYIGETGALGSFVAPLLSSPPGQAILLGGLIFSAAALLITRGFAWAVAILLPFPIALVLARLGIYPMDGRTVVFLLPLVLLLIGASVSWLVVILPRENRGAGAAVTGLLVLLFTVVLVDRPPVYVVQQDREVIRELSRRSTPDEPVFAHPWSRSALAYYGPRFGVENAVVFGGDGASLQGDLDRLDAFKGEPSLWVLFTHSANRSLVLCYLDEVGVERERVAFSGGIRNNPVSLHRYDLSDPSRGASADAARSPVTADALEGDRPRCRRQEWRRGHLSG